MEALWDPGTQTAFEAVGVGRGWRCLEVGAGGGSIAEWLADTVGDDGQVVATDVSTRYLEPIARDNLEVLEHNILGDPLPEPGFDLVHSRLVVEHLGLEALQRMHDALRPGGWIVVEDYDMSGVASHPFDEAGDRTQDAVLSFMAEHGFDGELGRKLVTELEGLGLVDVAAEGRTRVYHGGSPGTAFIRLSLESIGPSLVESGRLSQEDLDATRASIDDPSRVFLSPIMIAARGRRPA
jgi:SAM-dependent methyltransferase